MRTSVIKSANSDTNIPKYIPKEAVAPQNNPFILPNFQLLRLVAKTVWI